MSPRFLVYWRRDVLAKKQRVMLVTDCISCRDTLCYPGLHFHAPETTSRFPPLRCRSIYFGHLGFRGAVTCLADTGGPPLLSFQVHRCSMDEVGEYSAISRVTASIFFFLRFLYIYVCVCFFLFFKLFYVDVCVVESREK